MYGRRSYRQGSRSSYRSPRFGGFRRTQTVFQYRNRGQSSGGYPYANGSFQRSLRLGVLSALRRRDRDEENNRALERFEERGSSSLDPVGSLRSVHGHTAQWGSPDIRQRPRSVQQQSDIDSATIPSLGLPLRSAPGQDSERKHGGVQLSGGQVHSTSSGPRTLFGIGGRDVSSNPSPEPSIPTSDRERRGGRSPSADELASTVHGHVTHGVQGHDLTDVDTPTALS